MPTGVEAASAVAASSSWLACCCQQFEQYIVQADKNLSDLGFEVGRLSAIVKDVENEVSRNQLGSSVNVAKNWLQRSAEVEEASKRLSRNFEAMCLPGLNVWSRYIIGKRASLELRKAKGLIEERDKILVASTTLFQQDGLQEKQIETTVVGMDPYLETALHYIDSNKVGMVGICGMGGVGKTTLLRKIHSEFLPGKARSKEFDKIMWAVVSKKPIFSDKITTLQNDIGRELGLSLDAVPDLITTASLEERASPIYEYLKAKSFLLLLDDLWDALELNLIGVPHPNNEATSHKQKVVLTSRSKKVCGQMQAANSLIDVKCLEDGDAWRLFQFNATEQTIGSHQDIPYLARLVMQECQGLPLALNTIGKALSTKVGDSNPWKGALANLKEAKTAEIPGIEDESAAMLYRLKISYDYLPSQWHKDCFLSCCLWPEDYSIEKEKLIECWFGLGIIPESSAPDTCLDIISNLKQVHLLESGDDDLSLVKMHDTIRDMSLWISSDCGRTKNKWLVKAGIGTNTAQMVLSQWHEGWTTMERLSLMNNSIEELPTDGVPTSSKLKVLMLQQNTLLRVVPGSLLLSAKELTYLDLSNTGIEELPGEIRWLHGLEYLNLSESYIRKLPDELCSLTELKYIYLSATNFLDYLPYGLISRLSKLQTLDVYKSRYTKWDQVSCRVSNATSEEESEICNSSFLEEFKARDTSLKRLGITLDKTAVLMELARSKLISIKRLCLKKMPMLPLHDLLLSSLPEHLGSLDMLKSLEEFMFSTCASLKEVTIDGSNQIEYCLPVIEKLKLVSLYDLELIRFKGISANQFLPNLRAVQLFDCHKLKNVNWLLGLPQLSHLELQFCNAMAALIDDTSMEHPISEIEMEQPVGPVFPLLKTLNIHSLCSLTCLYSGASEIFPALEILEITQCNNLKRLNILPQGNLREIRGGQKWWHGLDCEDNSTQKEMLLPYFRASRLKPNESQNMR